MEKAAPEVGEGSKRGEDVAADPTRPVLPTPWLDGGRQPESGGHGVGEEETSEGITVEDNQQCEEENSMQGKSYCN